MDREAQARETIVRMVQAEKDAVQRAYERGGLPTEQEQTEAYDALMRARDRLEAITWRVEGVSGATHASELPQPATFADIGIVATIADDAECFANNLREFADRLRDKIGVLDTLRDRSVRPSRQARTTDVASPRGRVSLQRLSARGRSARRPAPPVSRSMPTRGRLSHPGFRSSPVARRALFRSA
jgi:hypothetical protein